MIVDVLLPGTYKYKMRYTLNDNKLGSEVVWDDKDDKEPLYLEI